MEKFDVCKHSKKHLIQKNIVLGLATAVISIILFFVLFAAKWISEEPKQRIYLVTQLPVAAFKFFLDRENEKNYRPTSIPFDQQLWIKAAEIDGDLRIRFCMLANLTEHHKLVGMTKEELLRLLGTPTTDYIVGRRREYFVYEMGKIQGHEISLSISTSDGKVDRFEINKTEYLTD